MDDKLTVSVLKRTLLEEVRSFFRPNRSAWKEPILDVFQDLRQSQFKAVLFGGTLRSLLVSRIFQGRPGRPRDIDVVVSGATLSQLEERFGDILARRTRFGGLRLQNGPWQLDVWPIGETWAFKHDHSAGPADFAALPATTAFNLEAVAVEAWAFEGRRRTLFSGNDQFFDGILSRTIELNRVDNPFPELTVVRGIVLASELGFKVGPRLAGYIGDVGLSMNEKIVEHIQASHYGHARMNSRKMYNLIAMIARQPRDGKSCLLPVRRGQLPAMEQHKVWSMAVDTDVGESKSAKGSLTPFR